MQVKGPGDADFVTVGMNLPNPQFVFDPPAAGEYEARVAALNGTAQGPWSDPVGFTAT